MELIVNDISFSEDLKKALGFTDADISYERVFPQVEIATDEIVDIITEENYNQLIAFVNNSEEPDLVDPPTDPPLEPEDPPVEPVEPVIPDFTTFDELTDDQKNDFVRLVKYALLSKAFNMYVGLGDLSVTNNGRTMRRDDHQVSAFNWQIEKHDNELEQLYYRHLDRMLRFMMKHNLKINQDKYRHKDLIVNSLSEFEKFIDVKGSYALYIRLIPALREAEKLIILPRVGKVLFDLVKVDKTSELAFMVQKTIVYHALIWGFYKLELQIFPKGMLSHNAVYSIVNSKNTPETRVMRQTLAMNFEKDLERDLLSLEKMVTEINRPIEEIINPELEMPDFGFDCEDGFVNT